MRLSIPTPSMFNGNRKNSATTDPPNDDIELPPYAHVADGPREARRRSYDELLQGAPSAMAPPLPTQARERRPSFFSNVTLPAMGTLLVCLGIVGFLAAGLIILYRAGTELPPEDQWQDRPPEGGFIYSPSSASKVDLDRADKIAAATAVIMICLTAVIVIAMVVRMRKGRVSACLFLGISVFMIPAWLLEWRNQYEVIFWMLVSGYSGLFAGYLLSEPWKVPEESQV